MTSTPAENELERLRARIAQLESMNRAMMDRIERTVDSAGSAYSMFESNIVMQQTIRERTRELADANEELQREVQERLAAERELRAAKEAAEAASLAKTEFLANMSHEIRTPMTAILGFVDILATDRAAAYDPERVGEIAHTLRSNADHLLTVINGILDVSKIEAGEMGIEHVATDPAAIVKSVRDITSALADAKGIDVHVRFESELPSAILSDPFRIRQILLNLAGNGVKFTERGSVTISAALEDDRSVLKLSVEDTGIGMTPEQYDRIRRFEAFQQADESMSRRFGGTGLGLCISHGLSRLLGGSLTIESEQSRGTKAILRVPAELAPGATMMSPEAMSDVIAEKRANCDLRSETDTKPLQGLRVLLAEDGPDNQRLIAFHIRKAGGEIEVHDNGRLAAEAIEAAGEADLPDLVLMDMQMPELDGYAATRRLRDAGISLPIVALTAHALAGDRERCLEAGCDDYLTKPIDKAKLIETCREWAARHRERRRAA